MKTLYICCNCDVAFFDNEQLTPHQLECILTCIQLKLIEVCVIEIFCKTCKN